MQKILIVGAGFAGAVYARQLADFGLKVTVIDQRNHIAGNAYDIRHENGILYHKYGPHLFHTNNKKVFEWLSQFTEWYDYRHKVVALHGKEQCPLPINRKTINTIFGLNLKTREDAIKYVQSITENIDDAKNARDVLHNKIGKKLTEIFFEPYTQKMWNMSLEDMPPNVVERIDFKLEEEGEYFPNDQFQKMPLLGYTKTFENILNHKNITVKLNTPYNKSMSRAYDHTFNSMPIDVYFEYRHGELPYRSIRFREETGTYTEKYATVNFTDQGKFTRVTYWNNINPDPMPKNNIIRTLEEPCDYKDNNFERYYPVKDLEGIQQQKYNAYVELAKNEGNVTFIGRCGTYQYLDMHQVINQSLQGAQKYISKINTK